MKNKITIITGDINSGKTTYLTHLLESLTTERELSGVIAEGVYSNDSDRKSGFLVRSLKTGETRRLIDEEPAEDSFPVGRFWMSKKVLDWATDEIRLGIIDDIIVIDEIGHLELQCKGYYDVLKLVLSEFKGDLYLVVRKSLIRKVTDLFGIDMDQMTLIEVKNPKLQENE